MVWETILPALSCLCVAGCLAAESPAARELRLIPFPKSIQLNEGGFGLRGELLVEIGDNPSDRFAAENLCEEIVARTSVTPRISEGLAESVDGERVLILRAAGTRIDRASPSAIGQEGGDEAYVLRASPTSIEIRARGSRGLFWGVQTLKQLVRSNMKSGAIPSLEVHDWPSVRYRGFQDDITRGPNPLLETLKREIRLGAEVKQNFFTYYIEHQYAFSKHPEIGPKNGSLTPEELKELVAYAKLHHVEIIGNQQSFGHFEDILRHDRYAHLRETPSLLCPTMEESYALLDDLYSEQVPLLTSSLFNVCCDETWGLGTGPSKDLAAKIGVGGVYARHLRRIHDLLKSKYGKRMMMWGDIILQHPENLDEIPKDTVMLTWGYDARESFEDQIVPFARSGYEFFVCPGVSCWRWILPNFEVATKNIQNFIRDGVKHNALGVLNTTWDDDGEGLFHANWHGVFWGAECSWNASTTAVEDFNRRFGGVLLGEAGCHLGNGIERLSAVYRLRGYDGMQSGRFWTIRLKEHLGDPETAGSDARALLSAVDSAIEELEAARADGKVNQDLVKCLVFGASRMRLMASRTLALLEAAEDYRKACEPEQGEAEARELVGKAVAQIRGAREEHAKAKKEYSALWLEENKPYALDVVQQRYDAVMAAYDSLLEKLTSAAESSNAGKGLPSRSEVGLGSAGGGPGSES